METHLSEADDDADDDRGVRMRVVVVGAGEVGSSIAESLSTDHDVAVLTVFTGAFWRS